MSYYGIAGSWGYDFPHLRSDVKRTTSSIITRGHGIVVGGALGVDYFATRTAIALGAAKTGRIKVCLPVRLDTYCEYYMRKASEGVISYGQAMDLVNQLVFLYREAPKTILDETPFSEINRESYFWRNGVIADLSKELYAFHVNKTEGTQDTIDKVLALDKKVHVKDYTYQKKKTRNRYKARNKSRTN